MSARAVLICAALALPSSVAARPSAPVARANLRPSTVAVGQGSMVGFGAGLLEGTRPEGGEVARFAQRSFSIELRGGRASPEGDSDLGAQIGVEYGLRGAVILDESGSADHPEAPLEAVGSLGVALRALTFDLPFRGQLAFHLTPELAAGGNHWWSRTVRASLLAGARLALAAGAERQHHLELGYTLVPWTVADTPGTLEVHRVEHRMTASIGSGALGVAVRITVSEEASRAEPDAPQIRTGGQGLAVILEWRD